MNKKLYFLDEDEKDRILNLHESRTKKQYLISEDIATTSIATERPSTSFLGLPDALKGITQTGQLEQKKGSITSDEYKTFKAIKPEFNMAKSIGIACKTLKNPLGRSIDSEEQVKQLVSDIYDTWSDSQHTFYLDKSVAVSMGNKLKQFKSVPDLCLGIEVSSSVIPKKTTLKQFRRYSVNDNFLKLFWDIQGPGSTFGVSLFYQADEALVKKTVYDSLQLIIKKSLDIGTSKKDEPKDTKKVKETLVGWDKFPCVTTNPDAKKVLLKDGSVTYDLIGFYFYGNGRKMDKDTRLMSNYFCNPDGTIGEGVPQVVGGQANVEPKQQVTGVGVVTRNVQAQIPELMKMAGMEGQPINQDTINKLYDILSKK